jgi:hypothetical protein
MRSSLEEAKSLFNSWKHKSAPLLVVLVTGAEEANIGFLAFVNNDSGFPVVRLSVAIDDSAVFPTGLSLEATFDLANASFEYFDSREAPPDVGNAGRKYICVLKADFVSGNGASFLELIRKDDDDLRLGEG